MATEAKQIEVLNLEATSDGKKYSHRNSGSKDFGNTQREKTKSTSPNCYGELKWHKTIGATNQNEIQEDFIWGRGPEAVYQMTRGEYKTEPDKIKRKISSDSSMNTYYQNETRITTAENFSGQDRVTTRRLKPSGGD